jgi:hypothetical protein
MAAADILWQNSGGDVAFWEINGNTVIGASILAKPGPS